MFHKSRIYPIVLILLVFVVWKIRNAQSPSWISFTGQTMGTSYNIKFQGPGGEHLKLEIDSVLELFNASLSTYILNSEISQFNKDSVFYFDSPYFLPVLEKSREVYTATSGAFDPTVMPLVNAWGFGPDSSQLPDSAAVDSLLQFVGFENVDFDKEKVWKSKPGVEIDFSAIAKGYGVDIVAGFLNNKGIDRYFIEIGGEVTASGKNDKDKLWRVGIEDPTRSINDRSPKAIVELDNRAMATSGNYRNYYVKNGIKYAHTIDPDTGYPVGHSILSATVFARDCITADAYATSFMVMGIEKAKKILSVQDNLDAFLIFSDETGELKTFSTGGIGEITILE